LTAGAGRLRVRESSPGLLSITGLVPDTHTLRVALRDWLLEHAAAILAPLMENTARELGFTCKRISIRRQRTRWGSRSNRGTISLNCCLLFQRPEVVRYLLIHELAHTLHMNHSRRFWACVAQHCPDYRRLDRELAQGWRRVPAWVFDSK
jgi:predicted metal-dependent hydrolase